MPSRCLLLVLLLASLFALPCLAADYYATLSVPRTASDSQIKKAYRQLSKKFHPDKNPGDDVASARFVEVSQAYEVLSDKEKRGVYDRHGEEGLRRMAGGQAAGGFHDPMDLFSRFFGGGQQQQHQQRRGPNMVTDIEVALGAIYTGTTVPLTVQRKAICESCEGSGARKPSDIVQCSGCGGTGVKVVRQQLAPGMFTQMQVHCDQCGGRGRMTTHLCPVCRGHRVVQSTAQLDLDIDRGLAEGSEIVFEGEADESPEWAAGDIIVRVRSQAQAGGFTRKDAHLYWREAIGLSEALLGFERDIEHLDGHTLTLRRSGVTQPGFVQTVEGEGMPHHQSSGHGHLYVTYEVVLPATIEPPLRAKLEEALGKPVRRRTEL